jgi:hypothetical protein
VGDVSTGLLRETTDNAEDFKQGAKAGEASECREACWGTLLKIPLC